MNRNLLRVGLVGVILALGLLAACEEDEPAPLESVGAPPEISTAERVEVGVVPETAATEHAVLPQDAAALSAERLEQLQQTLFSEDSESWPWYALASTVSFDSPEQVNLYRLFYYGFDAGQTVDDLSPAERASLGGSLPSGWPCQRMPAAELARVLQTYFGISPEEVELPAAWVYLSDTDCYYTFHSGAVETAPVLTAGYETADGKLLLYYSTGADSRAAGVLTLDAAGHMLSNRPGQ